MATTPAPANQRMQHAAMWLIGPDMPGILRLASEFVTTRGGNIDKDIADKFGESAVVFMSVTARPEDITRMEQEKGTLKEQTGCGVVFQPMKQPTVPRGFQEDLHGFDIVTDDAPGLLAAVTKVAGDHGMLIVGHTGERRYVPGPGRRTQFGQKFVVMLPHRFDHVGFNVAMTDLVRRFNGTMVTPLRVVPGLLWWW